MELIAMSRVERALDVRASWPMRVVQAWDRFWFHPADPTVLGLMRICCGLMVLYIHFAYTYDLQTFFGKNAWLDLQTINEFRTQAPIVSPPRNWDPPPQ